MYQLLFLSDMATIFIDQLNLPINELKQFLSENKYTYEVKDDKVSLFSNEHLEIPFLIKQDEKSTFEIEKDLELKIDFSSIFKNFSSDDYDVKISLFEIKDVDVKLAKHINPTLIDNYYLRTEAGLYPDLLKKLAIDDFVTASSIKYKLDAKDARYIFDIVIESKNKDKKYPITKENLFLNFQLGKFTKGKVQEEIYSFTFINQVLEESSYKHTEWFHVDCIADYYDIEANSEQFFTAIRNFAKAGRDIHMNTIYVPIFTPPLDIEYMGHRTNVQLLQIEVIGDYLSPDCIYKFDFTYLKKYLQMMLDLKYRYFEICHLFSQWGAKFAIDVYAKVDGQIRRIFDNQVSATDDRYIRFIKILLRELKVLLDEFKIRNKAIFHISDEPCIEHLDNYKKIIEALGDELNSLYRIDAMSNYEFYNLGLVKEPVIALDALSNFVDNMTKEGKYWIYYCVSQAKDVCNRFMSMPLCRQRSLALILYLFDGAVGFLHWGFNFYNSQFSLEKLNPYESVDAGGKFIAGDAFLYYPGDDYIPEWSIRAMTMRRVFEDLAKLEFLEKILGREKLKKELEIVFDFSKKEFSFAKNAEEFKRVKSKINQLVEDLYK